MSKIATEWGTFKDSFLMALNAIRTSKLRSVLTILGIVVGIFSIISVMTAVTVLKSNIETGLSQLGANTFQVDKFTVSFNTTPEERRRMRNRKDITLEQAMQVRERVTMAEAVAFEAHRHGRTVFWNGYRTNPNVNLYGVTEDALITNQILVENGRGISTDDYHQARKVAILGRAVVEKLFPPSINPVGESVRIEQSVFRVIGVFEEKGSILGGDQNNFVYIPLSTFFESYGRHRSLTIMVKARSQQAVENTIEQTRAVLRTARQVPPGGEDDFGIFTNDSLISQFNEFTFYLRLGVLVVSSIALLAAGVGIMNIMLVSVTERTREIGIRKAIGARRSDVMTQFIIEAIVLCQIGGIVGVVLGIAGGNVVGVLVEAPAVVPWDWAAIGLGVCSIVGIAFGVYPAWKASTLDPIEALRYE